MACCCQKLELEMDPYLDRLYVIGVLISAAYIVWRKPFLTAEVKHSKCNFCGAQMETIELRCMKCQSDATKNRPKAEPK